MFLDRYDIIIIGAGPAGLIAALECHKPGARILIMEKKHRPAMKLRLSGKGRCNITNSADLDSFIAQFGKNGRFLKSAFNQFFNSDLLVYFGNLGVNFKLERGGRFFPQKDNSLEVVNALLAQIDSLEIPISTEFEAVGVSKPGPKSFHVIVKKKNQSTRLISDQVLIATGGKSYPATGSDGSGYKLAIQMGHKINSAIPALVPIEIKGDIPGKLSGLGLKNIKASIWCDKKKIKEQFGELLFTDFGLSGPVVLSLSKTLVRLLEDKKKVSIHIDLKPALTDRMVDQRLLREIERNSRLGFRSLLKKLIPQKMIPFYLERLQIEPNKPLHQINAGERRSLRILLKELRLKVKGHRPFQEAIITSGGVKVNEINPTSMESKLKAGLFFAGEVIDIDAGTGGYNLQAAFSTGWLAGRSMKARMR